MTSYQQVVTPLEFFQFMANLEQSRSQISNEWYVTLTFALTVTFDCTKTVIGTRNSLKQLSYYCFEQRYYS